MNWSGPNVIHFGRKSQFGPDQFILVMTKSLWSSPNEFGQTKTILDRPKLLHRRTRHKSKTPCCSNSLVQTFGHNLQHELDIIRAYWPALNSQSFIIDCVVYWLIHTLIGVSKKQTVRISCLECIRSFFFAFLSFVPLPFSQFILKKTSLANFF